MLSDIPEIGKSMLQLTKQITEIVYNSEEFQSLFNFPLLYYFITRKRYNEVGRQHSKWNHQISEF